MNENTPKSPGQILQRLEELKKWQEQQQQLLIQRQNSQRQLLDEEQKILYEKLGFSSSKSAKNPPQVQQSKAVVDVTPAVNETGSSSSQNAMGNSTVQALKQDDSELRDLCADARIKIKRPFLKRGEGIVSRFKVDPEKFRLHNLPKYKYAHKSQPGPTECLPEKLPNKFKKTGSYMKLRNTSLPEKSDAVLCCSSGETQEISSRPLNEQQEDDRMRQPNYTSMTSSTPISWADVLNPNSIKSVSLEGLRRYSTFNSTDSSLLGDSELENLSLFELLEKKAQEGSILIDSSILKRWMENARSPSKIDAEPLIDIESTKLKRVSPLPCDVVKKILADESDESSANEEEYNSDFKFQKQRVRFSDNVEINEINSESESDATLENGTSYLDESTTSFCSKQNNENCDETNVSDTLTSFSMNSQQINLIEKTDLLKSRLADLEREILEFQKQNSELTRLKQECEIEKIRLNQEREDVENKLKDERLKMEIQLHDERMQIEAERKKYERLVKDHRTKIRKECDEISNLKEQVERLQKDSREKDAKHSASQSRFRAQIRNLEKEVRECNMEIDVLKKEKKRLEGENSRLMRQNSNKMLQEINKSIAKLVPKCVPVENEVTNKNTKSLVAKVTSHSNVVVSRRQSNGLPGKVPSPKTIKSCVASDETDSDSTDETKSAYFKEKLSVESNETSEMETPRDTARTASLKKPYASQDELKREIINQDGSKDIWYTNGNLKKISADGMLIRMLYYNKDIKETNINEGTVKYYYAEANTWHTTYLDGLEILEFPNGQTEHRYKDGTVEVHFENGSIRINNPSDPAKEEEWRYPDGTRLIQLKTGDKILSFPNGQKEIHTKLHKRREYPDGTVKIVYPDGSQESRYSNGRVRIKDKDGNLIMDSEK